MHALMHARCCCCCISALERLCVYESVPFTLSEITKWNYICCLAVSLPWLFCGGGRKSISVIVCTKITAKRWKRGCNPHHAVPDFHGSPVFLSILCLIQTTHRQARGRGAPYARTAFHERRSTCNMFVRPGNVGFFPSPGFAFPLMCFWIFFLFRVKWISIAPLL